MRITEYIQKKHDIHLFNLSDNQKIIDELELNVLPANNTFLKIDNQHLSYNGLVIIIINSSMILDGSIFKNIIGLNNILMLTIYDDFFIEHETECKDIMISHGYKYFGNTTNDKAVIFIYDISKYKENPDWLNSDNWANPELWEK
jgi:hypothetical protein